MLPTAADTGHTRFYDTQDPFSTITFDRANVFTGRAGWVLRGSFGSIDARWQPYLKGNVWWGSNGFDTVRFDDVPIQTGRNGIAFVPRSQSLAPLLVTRAARRHSGNGHVAEDAEVAALIARVARASALAGWRSTARSPRGKRPSTA